MRIVSFGAVRTMLDLPDGIVVFSDRLGANR